MFGLLHRISAFLRLVSQRPFRVRPRWHLSVRVNQKKFIVLQLLLKARVIREPNVLRLIRFQSISRSYLQVQTISSST